MILAIRWLPRGEERKENCWLLFIGYLGFGSEKKGGKSQESESSFFFFLLSEGAECF